MTKRLTVKQGDIGQRLDLFLSLRLNQFTRSFIKKQINDNRVKVNGDLMYKANYKVKEEDIIYFDFVEEDQNKDVEPENIKIDVIYEDDDLVAVKKPAGMVVHPATGNYAGTLVNALLYKYKDMKHVGQRIRAGLINRIDKDTSGIVLVGKTNRALWFYSRQFANREVSKTYLAVVKGDFSKKLKGKKSVKIANYIARNPKTRTKFAVVDPSKGKLAVSNINLISVSHNKEYSFLEVGIETGRTHQIRVHLNDLGYPVVGDTVYSGEKYKRLLLHSYSIEISLLSGNQIKLVSEPEGDFRKFLLDNFSKKNVSKFIK